MSHRMRHRMRHRMCHSFCATSPDIHVSMGQYLKSEQRITLEIESEKMFRCVGICAVSFAILLRFQIHWRLHECVRENLWTFLHIQYIYPNFYFPDFVYLLDYLHIFIRTGCDHWSPSLPTELLSLTLETWPAPQQLLLNGNQSNLTDWLRALSKAVTGLWFSWIFAVCCIAFSPTM